MANYRDFLLKKAPIMNEGAFEFFVVKRKINNVGSWNWPVFLVPRLQLPQGWGGRLLYSVCGEVPVIVVAVSPHCHLLPEPNFDVR